MNARESLAADREAEECWNQIATYSLIEDGGPERMTALALLAIAAELRAARIYANYLEGREKSRTSEKRKAAAWAES